VQPLLQVVVLQETILGNTDLLESSEPGHQLQELKFNGGATPSCTSETLDLVVAVALFRIPKWHRHWLATQQHASQTVKLTASHPLNTTKARASRCMTTHLGPLQFIVLIRYIRCTLLFALIIQYALSTQGHGHVNPVHAREALRHANANESCATIGKLQLMAADVITIISARSSRLRR
jgi:hypothetical protein